MEAGPKKRKSPVGVGANDTILAPKTPMISWWASLVDPPAGVISIHHLRTQCGIAGPSWAHRGPSRQDYKTKKKKRSVEACPTRFAPAPTLALSPVAPFAWCSIAPSCCLLGSAMDWEPPARSPGVPLAPCCRRTTQRPLAQARGSAVRLQTSARDGCGRHHRPRPGGISRTEAVARCQTRGEHSSHSAPSSSPADRVHKRREFTPGR